MDRHLPNQAAPARPLSGPPPGARKHLPRKLRHILSLADFETAARKHLPRPLYGYVSGGVEDNSTLYANRTAFEQWMFRTRVLRDVSARCLDTTLLGQCYRAPFGIAPMGICALNAFDGDVVMAAAAEAAGVPYILSGASLTPMEAVAQAGPKCSWFQAYLPGELSQIEALTARARNAGFDTLVLTVDTPTLANRENNVRTGFSTPLRPSMRLAWDGITHPRWLFATLARTLVAKGMPHFENAGAARGVPVISRTVTRQFGQRDRLSWTHVQSMRRLWTGKLVLKGVTAVEDVQIARDHGIDGVIVSNHGGRQLDGTLASLDALRQMTPVKGSLALMMDGGIQRGTDIAKALSLGADFVFIGRPMLYAAAIGGQAGVAHAISLLVEELLRNMAFLGLSSTDQLGPENLALATR